MTEQFKNLKNPLLRLRGKMVKVSVAIADSVNFFTGILSETDGESVLLGTAAGQVYLASGYIISIEVVPK